MPTNYIAVISMVNLVIKSLLTFSLGLELRRQSGLKGFGGMSIF
jgi:hypothetical protein